jgi:hypothetical protein
MLNTGVAIPITTTVVDVDASLAFAGNGRKLADLIHLPGRLRWR